jgi:hypothetical protein
MMMLYLYIGGEKYIWKDVEERIAAGFGGGGGGGLRR